MDEMRSPTATIRPSFRCELLEWDTAFFGFRIGRLFVNALGPDDLPAMQAWRRENGVVCLYCLLPAINDHSRQTLELNGFQLVDLRLTLLHRVEASVPPIAPWPPGITIRQARLDDLPALRRLAQDSHGNTRFFSDAHFPRERCRELYSTWIEQSCRDDSDGVLLAYAGEHLAGYCTGELLGDGQARLGLCAVAASAQGRGVGQALVSTSVGRLRERGAQRIRLATQGSNQQAYRLYRRCGFVTEAIELWYHGWFEDD